MVAAVIQSVSRLALAVWCSDECVFFMLFTTKSETNCIILFVLFLLRMRFQNTITMKLILRSHMKLIPEVVDYSFYDYGYNAFVVDFINF